MFYEAELRFLRDTFKKCCIQTNLVDISQPLNTRQDLGLFVFMQLIVDTELPLRQILPPIQSAVIYRMTDPLFCQYLYLQLPDLSEDLLLLIGPFLPSVPTDELLMEWTEQSGLPLEEQKLLSDHYHNIPILPTTSHLYMVLDTFAERLWGTNGYQFEQVDRNDFSLLRPMQEKAFLSEEKDSLWNVKNMELRYSYENDLINAVSKGQSHKADILLNNFTAFSFEQRLIDPIRNAKNYCIIMNTLLRKAAEQGGVHPVYLDSQSSLFATEIEQLPSLDRVEGLMAEMIRAYCRLVRNHSVKNYSPPIQKIITVIDSDLTADLSLHNFARILNVSSSYLSTLFKKETGQTLTEYINSRRIKYASHLLGSTKLQIQTIAQHCGIVDVQYFSKVFKRLTGKTPKEYRDALKR